LSSSINILKHIVNPNENSANKAAPADYVACNRGALFVRPCPVALRRNKALHLMAQPSNLRFAACSAGGRRDYVTYMNEFRKICGFIFVKVGGFFFSDKPHQFKNWTSEIVINLTDERFEKADESVYVITCNDGLLYVGEYTYNFKARWISQGHVNHHMYDNIYNSLKDGKDINIWLAVSPYVVIPEYGEMNISKSLEQEITKQYKPEWNSRNKNSDAKEWREKNCIRLDSFIDSP